MTTRQVVAWILVIPLGPIVIALAFFSTLFREIGRAFQYAWYEVLIEVSSIRRALAGTDVQGDKK